MYEHLYEKMHNLLFRLLWIAVGSFLTVGVYFAAHYIVITGNDNNVGIDTGLDVTATVSRELYERAVREHDRTITTIAWRVDEIERAGVILADELRTTSGANADSISKLQKCIKFLQTLEVWLDDWHTYIDVLDGAISAHDALELKEK